MDDHNQDHSNNTHNSGSAYDRDTAGPVRSRWTPKPEQILILESIFNSGMVNPPKEETVRIRKLLERYGSVGDANVFYWFQNRRSRSRRRQRQMQAAAALNNPAGGACAQLGGASLCDPNALSSGYSNNGNFFSCYSASSASSATASNSNFIGDDSDDLFAIPRQMGYMESKSQVPTYMCSTPEVSQLQYQPGTITVFINGLPTEVPSDLINMRALFGEDAVLVNSSGELLPINEYGILMQSLQMGESYFLVSRPT